jgi:hypothetical protein
MARTTKAVQQRVGREPRPVGLAVAAIAIAVIALLAVVIGIQRRGGDDGPAASTERPAMGQGPAQTAAISVDRAVVDAGRVPLNTPIQQEFRLRNTGDEAVTLGRARVEVLEGC